jgi:hypothetical protein
LLSDFRGATLMRGATDHVFLFTQKHARWTDEGEISPTEEAMAFRLLTSTYATLVAAALIACAGSTAAAQVQVRPDFPGAKQADPGAKQAEPNVQPQQPPATKPGDEK